MPIPSPAKHAIENDVKPASSAAPSAGTTWKASVCASSAINGATSTPSPPATTLASTVFAIARRLGERPTSIAETSLSDDARVDRPNGVQRYIAARSIATTTTIPASQNRSSGTTRSKIVTVPVGRIEGADFVSSEKTTITPASSTSRRPSDAASRASGAVSRSGRKIASSIATPNRAMQTSVRKKAGPEPRWKPKYPVLNAQKKYAASIAIAPIATLMTPEPR
jgi:hypothetical protein